MQVRSVAHMCLMNYKKGDKCNCPEWVSDYFGCDKEKIQSKQQEADYNMKRLPDHVKLALEEGRLDFLTDRKQKILRMRCIEGQKGKEVAEELDLSEKYISKLKNEAIKQAKDYLEAKQAARELKEGKATPEESEGEPEKEITKAETEMLLMLINGEDPVRVHPDSDVSKLIQLLADNDVEAEMYEKRKVL